MSDEELLELHARLLDYEHALQHVADAHDGGCESCQRLARSALDGDGREDFREMARDLRLERMGEIRP